jgi:hypothetical protein
LLGQVLATIDPRGEPTLDGYDLDSRQIFTIDPRGDVSQTQYDPAGNVAATIDARRTLRYSFHRCVLLLSLGNWYEGSRTQHRGCTSPRQLGHGALHQLTSDQHMALRPAFAYDPTRGVLTRVNRGLGASYATASGAMGALAGGRSGLAWASATDARSHTTRFQQVPRKAPAASAWHRNGFSS